MDVEAGNGCLCDVCQEVILPRSSGVKRAYGCLSLCGHSFHLFCAEFVFLDRKIQDNEPIRCPVYGCTERLSTPLCAAGDTDGNRYTLCCQGKFRIERLSKQPTMYCRFVYYKRFRNRRRRKRDDLLFISPDRIREFCVYPREQIIPSGVNEFLLNLLWIRKITQDFFVIQKEKRDG